MKTREELIDELIDLSLAEDIGDGDATTLCCIPADEMGRQRLIVKEEGILAGVEIARRVFEKFDPELRMEVMIGDGAHVVPGDVAFVVTGRVRSLLQTERLMLNIMQRMSGVATTTARYAKCLEGLKTRVLDTRKTTPGMRMLEKEAVKIGGGCNHRIGLFDMILLKDNHVDFAGGIVPAIDKARQWCKDNGKSLKIEIEVRNLDELQQVLDHGGVDRVMLDNFSIENTHKAVELIAGRIETESSGGITIDTLRAYGECGVDYISVGGISQRGYSSSDSEGYVQPHRDGPDQLGESPPPLQGGTDVKVNKLISSLRGIFSAQFHRIPNLLEPKEIDSFDSLTVLNVKTRDYPLRDHNARSSNLILPSYNALPTITLGTRALSRASISGIEPIPPLAVKTTPGKPAISPRKKSGFDPENIPSLDISVTITFDSPGRNELIRLESSTSEVSIHPPTATFVPRTSAPRVILSGPYSSRKDLNRTGLRTAKVPNTTLEAPAASRS